MNSDPDTSQQKQDKYPTLGTCGTVELVGKCPSVKHVETVPIGGICDDSAHWCNMWKQCPSVEHEGTVPISGTCGEVPVGEICGNSALRWNMRGQCPSVKHMERVSISGTCSHHNIPPIHPLE